MVDFIPNISIPGLGVISIPGIGTRNLSIPSQLSLKKLENKELLKIIIKRIAYKQNPAINANPIMSAAFGQPDFLPFPFLSLGIRRGAAVCRLIREFSSDSAESFINTITQAEDMRKKFFSLSELAEICCISLEKAQEVFEINGDDLNNLKIPLKAEHFSKNLKRLPVATGFLVGRNQLLTNYHIFPLQNNELTKALAEYSAEFNYEQDILGREIKSLEYGFDKLLAFDQDLDFALIKLKSETKDGNYPDAGQAGDQFGWIPLIEDDSLIAPPLPQEMFNSLTKQLSEISAGVDLKLLAEVLEEIPQTIALIKGLKDKENSRVEDLLAFLKDKAKLGDPVNIIQHPKGRHKEVVLSNNRVKELYDNFIFYEADADFSSSGSPVMNQQWQLVGLHCGALPKPNQANSETLEIDQEVGVRTGKIVKKLLNGLESNVKEYWEIGIERQKITRELWFFVREFVQLRESKDKVLPPPGLEDIAEDYKQVLQKLPSSLY
ncbi:hypothetical protein CLI64_10150 [Nostoc sp. CENA543]|uniref:trypsin-like serine peptidase n=1 Tax=Nostoc sp. CENA543 TaxID=1869241 RepID=UPI000CA2C485|nr:serine protease [Nostoc sp. CENA543]AUT00730.1 hypothetical protein CLI64_10150 [Nostoc sp. CENA543]